AGQAGQEDRWEHWLVHLLWAVSIRTSLLGEAALGDSPLSLASLGMLENLNARPGLTIAELSRRAPQTQQALSQIAARLEKLGCIERKLVPGSRGIGLYLTDAGARARVSAHETVEAFEAHIADALGTDRYQRLIESLAAAQPIIRALKPEPAAAVEAT
ncbi:MarR family winged helix-turn-helix transcriptional regulator, partial [Frankia casuarinae]|uniref:MarR family winged helix-turn-helix transcriptional regulator n=2 Tax=Frankia TaxID=1854 RepID=UPI0007C227C3